VTISCRVVGGKNEKSQAWSAVRMVEEMKRGDFWAREPEKSRSGSETGLVAPAGPEKGMEVQSLKNQEKKDSRAKKVRIRQGARKKGGTS